MQSGYSGRARKVQEGNQKATIGDNFHEEELRRNQSLERPDFIDGRLLLIKDGNHEKRAGGTLCLKLKPEQDVRAVREGREGGQQGTQPVEIEGDGTDAG